MSIVQSGWGGLFCRSTFFCSTALSVFDWWENNGDKSEFCVWERRYKHEGGEKDQTSEKKKRKISKINKQLINQRVHRVLEWRDGQSETFTLHKPSPFPRLCQFVVFILSHSYSCYTVSLYSERSWKEKMKKYELENADSTWQTHCCCG